MRVPVMSMHAYLHVSFQRRRPGRSLIGEQSAMHVAQMRAHCGLRGAFGLEARHIHRQVHSRFITRFVNRIARRNCSRYTASAVQWPDHSNWPDRNETEGNPEGNCLKAEHRRFRGCAPKRRAHDNVVSVLPCRCSPPRLHAPRFHRGLISIPAPFASLSARIAEIALTHRALNRQKTSAQE